jgi:hypothetical protein
LIGSVLLGTTYLSDNPTTLDSLNPLFDKLAGVQERPPPEQHRNRKLFFPEQLTNSAPTSQEVIDQIALSHGILPMPPKKTIPKAKRTPRNPPQKPKLKGKTRGKPRSSVLNAPASYVPAATAGTAVAAPFSIGMNVGPSLMPRSAGPPQMDTTVTSSKTWTSQMGERIVGSDYFQYVLTSTTSAMGGYNCLSLGDGNNTNNVALSPTTISTRLEVQETLYMYYAFREVLFEILPGTAPNAAEGTQFLSFGIIQDWTAAEQLGNNAYLFGSIAQVVPSVSFTAWEGAKLTYKYAGQKVFECTTDSADKEDYFQASIAAGSRSEIPGSGTSPVLLGVIRVTYVIDFYCPSFFLLDPAYSLSCMYTKLARVFATIPVAKRTPEGIRALLGDRPSIHRHDNPKTRAKRANYIKMFEYFCSLMITPSDEKIGHPPEPLSPPTDPVEYVEVVPPPGMTRAEMHSIATPVLQARILELQRTRSSIEFKKK